MTTPLTADLRRAGQAALAASARAFARAQKLGYVWIGEQGAFETHDEIGGVPDSPNHPNQLRLA
jgi:hypothetical protein